MSNFTLGLIISIVVGGLVGGTVAITLNSFTESSNEQLCKEYGIINMREVKWLEANQYCLDMLTKERIEL